MGNHKTVLCIFWCMSFEKHHWFCKKQTDAEQAREEWLQMFSASGQTVHVWGFAHHPAFIGSTCSCPCKQLQMHESPCGWGGRSWVEVTLSIPTYHITVPGFKSFLCFPSSSLLIYPWKAAADAPGNGVSGILVGDTDEILDSWLLPGQVPVLGDIWNVNHGMENPFSVSVFQIIIIFLKR